MLCDGGERYLDTYYDDGWLARNGFDLRPYAATLDADLESGTWTRPAEAPSPGPDQAKYPAQGA